MNPSNSPPGEKETNSSDQAPLSEKDFIQNSWSLASLPFWLWLSLAVVLIALIWGTRGWYEGILETEKSHDPFLEVTNREFSVFLWEFPSFLRVNVSKKAGYLPGFLSTNENFNVATADEFVSAPPDLIFLYHTWHRLLSPEFIERLMSPTEFDEFLEQLPEWQPKNWKQAPEEYVQLISSKSYSSIENLQTLSGSALPLAVRQAFQGWKNYFKEGPQINEVQPTFAKLKTFLEQYPHYARNDWRNIDEVYHQQVAGANYLYAFEHSTYIPDSLVPNDQLAPFLKVGLFNFEQAQLNR